MAVLYQHPTLGLPYRDYPLGVVAVLDGDERVHVCTWPEDANIDRLVRAIAPADDCDESDVSYSVAHALRGFGVDPFFVEFISFLVEHDWSYDLQLAYDGGAPMHRATVSEGQGEDWQVLASAVCADHAEALGSALLMALHVDRAR